jgi:ligand-binding sensor domain-containing protein
MGSDIISGAKNESLARRFPDGRYEIVALPDSIEHHMIYGLQSDLDGRLWVSTASGFIVRERDGGWRTPEDDARLLFSTSSIMRDDEGSIWFGGSPGARIHHRDGSWEQIAPESGLAQRSVSDIEIAQDGSVWFVGDGTGVSILHPEVAGP